MKYQYHYVSPALKRRAGVKGREAEAGVEATAPCWSHLTLHNCIEQGCTDKKNEARFARLCPQLADTGIEETRWLKSTLFAIYP